MSRQPRISAVLNNCALHSLTPEIKDEIISLAEGSSYRNGFDGTYELLKEEFAQFYDLDSGSFGWDVFAATLAQYNAFGTQIIFGPVLRGFMSKQMEQVDRAEIENLVVAEAMEAAEAAGAAAVEAVTAAGVPGYIKAQTEMDSDTGRYSSLSIDVVFKFVALPLGFNLVYYQGTNTRSLEDVEGPIAEIAMYHEGGAGGAGQGGHWERAPEDQRIGGTEAMMQFPEIVALLGNDWRVTAFGLGLLKQHVRLSTAAQADTASFETLALTAAQVEKFIANVMLVPKTFAKRLLIPEPTADAGDFIEGYGVGTFDYDGIYETIISGNFFAFRDGSFLRKGSEGPEAPPAAVTDHVLNQVLQLVAPFVVPRGRVREQLAQEQEESALQRLLNPASSPEQQRAIPVDEISALLPQLEEILASVRLRECLFNLCDQARITEELDPAFIDVLRASPHFEALAGDSLRRRAVSMALVEVVEPPQEPVFVQINDALRSQINDEKWAEKGYSQLNLLYIIPIVGWFFALVWGVQYKVPDGVTELQGILRNSGIGGVDRDAIKRVLDKKMGYSLWRQTETQKLYDDVRTSLFSLSG